MLSLWCLKPSSRPPVRTKNPIDSQMNEQEVQAKEPHLHHFDLSPVAQTTIDYLNALNVEGFQGDSGCDNATRITFATDNSIYQIPPEAVIFPRSGSDISLAIQLANKPEFKGLNFLARGGGTSCNGQTLGDGIIIDTSRHMCGIGDFDPDKRTVVVEPGVILDQLTGYLKPHGFFFPPHVSTSSRATIGGMVSNDSSGKGSVVYGKTSNHIEALEVVLPDGREFEIRAQAAESLSGMKGQSGALHRAIADTLAPHYNEIERVFPDLDRGFSGYNLRHARNSSGDLSVPHLIAGSEGTLCLIKSITCRITPIPKFTAVVAIRYSSLDAGLRAVPGLLEAKPSAIEFIDDKILSMAEESDFWASVASVLGDSEGEDAARAMHFVEFEGNSKSELETKVSVLTDNLTKLSGQKGAPLGWRAAMQAEEINSIWNMRKACQGLLLAQQTERRTVPFVEDTVVTPHRLADFIAELKDMLRSHGVDIGMFGHADVGVVHIRPLLDMTQPDDRRLIRTISDKVFELTQRYGGLIWGEHGKGFRGEYSEATIGPRLLQVMAEVKGLFDPDNRLNPGKIVTPANSTSTIVALDAVPMRGEYDQAITSDLTLAFPKATHCNGNGACFTRDLAAPICPSYKATRDRRYSPKGRAGLIREWLRLRSVEDETGLDDLALDIHDALATCLDCKSCSGGACPVRIDIPEMKAAFNEWYYTRHRRPISHHFVRHLEGALPFLARVAPLINALQSLSPVRILTRKFLGLVDLPKLTGTRFQAGLRNLGVKQLSTGKIAALPASERKNMVVIVPDGFTTFYEADVALAHVALIKKLGFRPVVLKYRASGKPLHAKGFLPQFRMLAALNAADFTALARLDLPLVGVDAATTLTYRYEYAALKLQHDGYDVQLLSEWLNTINLPNADKAEPYRLIQHCTEKSLHPETSAQWVEVFHAVGLTVEITNAGCCGMAGLFGHQTANQDISATLYTQTWREVVENTDEGHFMATGFSCRSQVKRFSQMRARHPAEVLLSALSGKPGPSN